MATTSDFRNGLCIQFNHDLYTIVSFQHVKPGKGGAFVRTKLKSPKTGKIIDHTFNAGVKIDTARVEHRSYQFLYKDAAGYHLMDTASFEQVTLAEAQVDKPHLLKEGQEMTLAFHQETAELISCELPPFVILKVSYTEPGFKGDTATKTLKPATLETDASLQVPLFIKEGDWVKVDTRTGQYVERMKQ